MDSLPLILAAAAVGAVWWSVFIRRCGLMPAGLLTLLVGVCLGHPFFHMGTITLDRMLFAALLISFGVAWRLGYTERWPLQKMDLPVLVLCGVVAASTLLTDWRWQENQPLSRLVFYFLMPTAMYWIARNSRLADRGPQIVLMTLAGAGFYLAITALGEKFDQYWMVFPKFIVSAEYDEFLGRGRGPLLNPTANGLLISLGLYSLLMLWPAGTRVQKLCVLAAIPVFCGGLFATLTRCVWLGAVLGLTVMVMATLPKRWKLATVMFGMLGITLVVPANWERLQSFKRDKHVSAAEMSRSAELRPLLAYAAWKIFQDKPYFGVGYGQYNRVKGDYLDDRSTELVLENARPYHQHNIFLSLLVETGLLGLVAFTAMLGMWVQAGWRLWRNQGAPAEARRLGLVTAIGLGTYVVNGSFQDMTIMPMVHMVVYFLAGTTMGLAMKHAESPARSRGEVFAAADCERRQAAWRVKLR